MATTATRVSLADFLASPDLQGRYELLDGAVIEKMSSKRFHSRTQRALLYLLDAWGELRGEVGVEWAVVLERNGQPWVPVPDVLFVSRDRLPDDIGDEACPVSPDLAVEIISPNQGFGEMTEKAVAYLAAGVARVWVVDTRSRTVTVFRAGAVPVTFRGDRAIEDEALPGLSLTPEGIFERAGL
ncbi:MAG: Uma2 family endonuclease [Geitlerinemataceae cyanobacterium]